MLQRSEQSCQLLMYPLLIMRIRMAPRLLYTQKTSHGEINWQISSEAQKVSRKYICFCHIKKIIALLAFSFRLPNKRVEKFIVLYFRIWQPVFASY